MNGTEFGNNYSPESSEELLDEDRTLSFPGSDEGQSLEHEYQDECLSVSNNCNDDSGSLREDISLGNDIKDILIDSNNSFEGTDLFVEFLINSNNLAGFNSLIDTYGVEHILNSMDMFGGYPLSQDLYLLYTDELESVSLSVQENKVSIDKEKALDQRKVFLDIYSKILEKGIDSGLNELFEGLRLLDLSDIELLDEKLDFIVSKLSNKEVLFRFLDKIREADGDINSEGSLFSQVSQSLISIDPSFRDLIQQYYLSEQNIDPENPDTGSDIFDAMTNSALGYGNREQYGSIIKSSGGEGDEIFLDVGELPPKRYLGLEGSDYRLETGMPVADFYEPTVKYEKVRQEELPKIQKLGGIVNFFESPDFNKIDLDGLKNFILETSLSLYSSLGIANMTSKEQIKTSITTIYVKAKDTLLEAQKTYKEELLALRSFYYDSIREQDEQKRKVLEFIKNIGFDLIPQNITDTLIRELQSGVIMLDLGPNSFDPQQINLSEGRFGESDNEAGGDKWKQNMLLFMNKLVYGNSNQENTIFNQSLITRGNIDPRDIISSMKSEGVFDGTFFNIDKIRQNLSQSNQSQ